jgi:Tol biopolymer transport system component
LLVVLLAGCSFRAGKIASGDASPGDDDAPVDVAGDAPEANCYGKWLDGTVQIDDPIPLTTANSLLYDRDPFLTADELTLWFASGRTGSTGGGSVYKATRTSIDDPFGTPAIDEPLDSDKSESKVSMTADGLVAFIGTDRLDSQMVDVWMSTRTSTDQPFPAFVKAMGVNSAGNDFDPTISADGLHLYYAPDAGGQKVIMRSRADRDSAFGTPVTVVNTGAGDADPSPSPDERILLFASNTTLPGALLTNVWYLTRDTTDDPWSEPRPVPTINTDAAEGDPHLSADGCRIYFARDLGGYNYDLYAAIAH